MQAYKSEEGGDMSNESRIVRVETVIEHIQYMLSKMDKRFDGMDEKFDRIENGINEKLSKIDSKIDITSNRLEGKIDSNINRLEGKIDTNFKWVVGMMITLFVLNGFLPTITKLVSSLIKV